MSSGWQIYYDFLSATTKLLSPKSRWLRFAKMRVAFVSPKSVAVLVRAQVAQIIVNNNRKQWIAARNRLLQPQVGPALGSTTLSALGSFRQNAPRSRVPGTAQHEVVRCRPGTVTDRVLGGPGSA